VLLDVLDTQPIKNLLIERMDVICGIKQQMSSQLGFCKAKDLRRAASNNVFQR
jgi:hypothetical protein